VLIVLKSGSLNFLEPSGPVKACNWIALAVIVGKPQWPKFRVKNEVKINIKFKTVCTEQQFEINKKLA
jgi:hypothetical protein